MDYLVHLAILVCIYLILTQSFNLSFGFGSLLNLAHIATYSIGAYTTALLSTELNQSFWVCVPSSMALSGLFALLIGAIALKLSQDYFALGSLAFSSVVLALEINWKELTRGVLGIPGIPRPDIFGVDFYNNKNFLILSAVLATLSMIFFRFVFQSHFGRNLRAQAENPFAAMALAKDVQRIRNDSFIMSSIFAGLAGSLFAYYINYIDPSSFSLAEMVFILSIVIVGRPGSYWGAIFATAFLVLLPEPLRFINMSSSILGPMRQMLYALILFAVLYWKRAVLFPMERKI